MRGAVGSAAALTLLLAGAGCRLAGAESSATAGSPLFADTAPLAVVIEAPWRSFLRDRESRPKMRGTLSYREVEGAVVTLPLEIRAGGNWRLENCSTPPLRLRPDRDAAAGTLLAGQTTLWATTQCRAGERARQHLVREYLVYRMYRLLTEQSLGARMLEVEYRDSEGRRSWREHAFVVEDIALAAARLGRRWSEAPAVHSTALDAGITTLFTLFQFMIGHTDWSVLERPADADRCCHNAALLEPLDGVGGVIPVPYDFDASGLVDTGEHEPSEVLGIRSVRQRLYRGLCKHNDQLADAIGRLRAQRGAIGALIERDAVLSDPSRRAFRRYLEEFWAILDSPAESEKRISGACRG